MFYTWLDAELLGLTERVKKYQSKKMHLRLFRGFLVQSKEVLDTPNRMWPRANRNFFFSE